MSAYLAILGARFRTLLQYRAAALAGFATQLFWGLIRVMIFTAFFESSRAAQPMSLHETVTYIWLGQATLGLMPWGQDADIRNMVRTGTVAYELTKPVDLYGLWFSRAVANRVTPTLMRSIPLIAVAVLFFHMGVPPSLASLVAWICAMAGAIAVASAISALGSVFLVVALEADGMLRLLNALSYILSGMLLPIPLMPIQLQGLLNALPFRDIMDAPIRVYMGHIPAASAIYVVLHQAFWAFSLMASGKMLLGRAVRNLVVQGG